MNKAQVAGLLDSTIIVPDDPSHFIEYYKVFTCGAAQVDDAVQFAADASSRLEVELTASLEVLASVGG